ncbi:hypothetical protein [Streptomyces sp. NPDC002133]|uniref:hypothetical protein n=1 Tax=Streptomyces sp. NPDC002133 TaxID=3154409 RepID=UPI00331BD6DE
MISVICAPTTDTQVYGNTIVTDEPNTPLVSDNGPTGVTFRNNIFVGATGGSPINGTRSVYENNLYRRTSQPRDASGLTVDPLFASASPSAPTRRPPAPGLPGTRRGRPGRRRDHPGLLRQPDPAERGRGP